MSDSSAIYLIFSLLKVQIENLSLNKDDQECRKYIKTLERTECKTLFYNCISSTVWLVQKVQPKNIYIFKNYCIKALESSWNSILAILFSNNQTLNHHLLKAWVSSLFRFRLWKFKEVHLGSHTVYVSSCGHYFIIFSPFKSFKSISFCTPYRQPWQLAFPVTEMGLKALERRRKKDQIDTRSTIYVALTMKND